VLRLSFLGGTREVGRSAILFQTGNENILLDYGIKIEKKPTEYPSPVDVKLNGILLSHAHLDHSGAVPVLFHQKQKCPVYGLEITRPFSRLLWFDSLKISRCEGEKTMYTEKDIRTALKKFIPVRYHEPFTLGRTRITPFDAGHIPGSAMFLLEVEGKKVLYTGDLKLSDTRLTGGADMDIPDVDVLIIESTYAQREHPDRQEEELKFMDAIKYAVTNGGLAIVPCFALARSQEVLLILDEYELNYPIYIDGMAQKATNIINRYPYLQREYNCVRKALVRTGAKFVDHPARRRKIIKQSCVVITTSGMLTGGAVVYYIKKLFDRQDCSLLLTGFQMPGTEGANLLKTGRYIHDSLDLEVKMFVKKFDFSSHASRSELFEFVKKVRPKKVFCVHGDKTNNFADELQACGFDAVAPSQDESFTV